MSKLALRIPCALTLLFLVVASDSCGSESGPETDRCNPLPCARAESCGVQDDGCGSTIDCGQCELPLTCQDGTCECVPETCAELGKSCGEHPTTCGSTIGCGSCELGYACDALEGVCATQAHAWVSTPDGIRLWTRVYLPKAPSGTSLSAILYRTPYRSPQQQSFFDDLAGFYTDRGYAFVLQDVRGMHGSEGNFYPMLNEAVDGRISVEWITNQSWSNGRVGTLGSSYDGFTALAAAVDNPLVSVVLADDPAAGVHYWIRGGVLSMGVLAYYWGDVDLQQDAEWTSVATNALFLSTLDSELMGASVPVWQDLLHHPSPVDPFWEKMRLEPVVSRICAPVFLANSTAVAWDQPTRLAHLLWERACAEHHNDVRLVIGNFGHGENMTSVVYGHTAQGSSLLLDYVDKYLGDASIDLSGVPSLQYYAQSDELSRSSSVWPPPTTDDEMLYLHGSENNYGALSNTPPTEDHFAQMVVDPEAANPCDAADPDNEFLAFTGGSFAERVFVAGTATASLHLSGSSRDADVFIALIDFDPSAPSEEAYGLVSMAWGKARYRNGYASADPLPQDEPVGIAIGFPPMSWVFEPGHVPIVVVQGAQCTVTENPHTGEPLYEQSHFTTSVHRLHTTPAYPSQIHLPVVERSKPRKRLPPAAHLPEPNLVRKCVSEHSRRSDWPRSLSR